MGKRGPKPESAATKRAKGNPSRRPIAEKKTAPPAEPQVSGRIAPPKWLAKRKEALEIWNTLAPRLQAAKLLTALDIETFGRYCLNFAKWLQMQQRLDDMGNVYEIVTASGVVRRADPAISIASRLERDLQSAEQGFGLNPAVRLRIYAQRSNMPVGPGDLFAQTSPKDDKKTGESLPADKLNEIKPSVQQRGFLN